VTTLPLSPLFFLLHLAAQRIQRHAPEGGCCQSPLSRTRERGRGEGINDYSSAPRRASQTWAMLIKRVYEIDPLGCPKCGGQMKVIAFIEPPQGAVIVSETEISFSGVKGTANAMPQVDLRHGF